MSQDRYSDEYRRACLVAGLDLVDGITDPGSGSRNAVWTGDGWRALALVAWGGGDLDEAAAELAARLHKGGPEAKNTAARVRTLSEPPALPADAWKRWKAGDTAPQPRRQRPKAPAPKPTPPAHVRPSWGELGALLNRCGPVDADPQVAGWLEGRGIDPAAVERGSVPAFALPPDAHCPGWGRGPVPDGSGWGPWSAVGYRLLVPLWDPAGDFRSVRARSIVERPEDQAKCLPPLPVGETRFNVRGLVLANAAAVALLCTPAPTPWVVVVEGEPDWLSFAAALPDVPVLGVASGAWRAAFALRFPGASWWLATDDNKAGDGYAAGIAATLPPGAAVYRCRAPRLWPEGEAPGKAPDWNEALQARLWAPDPEGARAALTATAERYAPPKDRP